MGMQQPIDDKSTRDSKTRKHEQGEIKLEKSS